jgi:hypothetical protein
MCAETTAGNKCHEIDVVEHVRGTTVRMPPGARGFHMLKASETELRRSEPNVA